QLRAIFVCNTSPNSEVITLSLHDALPILLHPRVAARVVQHMRGERSTVPDLLNELSDRELEVLHLIAEGSSNAAIAEKLVISERSEEHTSELQSPCNLVCRLLLEKKKTFE